LPAVRHRIRFHGPTTASQELAMPPRTAKQILAEWHALALERDEATDTDISEGLAARIEQLRREYIEGTPPEATTAQAATDIDDEPRIQMKLPL
jgi:hypothetical protein